MSKCKVPGCGSYALNDYPESGLCDKCYWKTQVEAKDAEIAALKAQAERKCKWENVTGIWETGCGHYDTMKADFCRLILRIAELEAENAKLQSQKITPEMVEQAYDEWITGPLSIGPSYRYMADRLNEMMGGKE